MSRAATYAPSALSGVALQLVQGADLKIGRRLRPKALRIVRVGLGQRLANRQSALIGAKGGRRIALVAQHIAKLQRAGGQAALPICILRIGHNQRVGHRLLALEGLAAFGEVAHCQIEIAQRFQRRQLLLALFVRQIVVATSSNSATAFW